MKKSEHKMTYCGLLIQLGFTIKPTRFFFFTCFNVGSTLYDGRSTPKDQFSFFCIYMIQSIILQHWYNQRRWEVHQCIHFSSWDRYHTCGVIGESGAIKYHQLLSKVKCFKVMEHHNRLKLGLFVYVII